MGCLRRLRVHGARIELGRIGLSSDLRSTSPKFSWTGYAQTVFVRLDVLETTTRCSVPSFFFKKRGSGKASSKRTCWAASLKHSTRVLDLKLKSSVAVSAKTSPSSRIQSTYSFSETLGTSLRLNHNAFVRTADMSLSRCRSSSGQGDGGERRGESPGLTTAVELCASLFGKKINLDLPGPNRGRWNTKWRSS